MSETTEPMIRLENVSRVFPAHGEAEKVRALRKVSLSVPKGARIAIRGESGSGKSTLLNLVGGLDAPTKGRVVVGGHELSEFTERELTRYRATTVGFVMQAFNLLPALSARENVELALEAAGAPRAAGRERADELLGTVGIAERAEHRPARLSGGEQQRVAIARALANRPSVLLADEPTGNLDRKSRRAVTTLLRELSEKTGTTLLIVTHDPNTVAACDTVYRLHHGRFTGEPMAVNPSRRADSAREIEEADDQDTSDSSDDDE